MLVEIIVFLCVFVLVTASIITVFITIAVIFYVSDKIIDFMEKRARDKKKVENEKFN